MNILYFKANSTSCTYCRKPVAGALWRCVRSSNGCAALSHACPFSGVYTYDSKGAAWNTDFTPEWHSNGRSVYATRQRPARYTNDSPQTIYSFFYFGNPFKDKTLYRGMTLLKRSRSRLGTSSAFISSSIFAFMTCLLGENILLFPLYRHESQLPN